MSRVLAETIDNQVTQPSRKKYLNIVLVIAAIAVILSAVYRDLATFFHRPDYRDFYIFYLAARALISGANLYTAADGAYIYPPFFAFILTPLAHFSLVFAHLTWVCINLALIVVISILGFRVLASGFQLAASRWQAAGACALALLMCEDQIYREFIQCQNDLLILAGFVLALYWLDRKPLIAGACLGLVADIKYQALFFLPFLVFRARWRVLLGLLAGIGAGALLPALMIGWNRNLEYLQIAIRGMANMVGFTAPSSSGVAHVPTILSTVNVSITNGLARIFHANGWPLNNALILSLIIAILIFCYLWWMFKSQSIAFIWRSPGTLANPQQEKAIISIEWCALLLCMLILSPESSRRHFILLLNANLLAAIMLLFPRPPLKRWPVLIAVLIAQVGQFHFSFSNSLPDGDYLGLPGWGYLIFLLVIIHNGLAYFRSQFIATQ